MNEGTINEFMSYGCGEVIGEFTCDEITKYPYKTKEDGDHLIPQGHLEAACLDGWLLYFYFGIADVYGWHISELKIYDKPKELSDFKTICKHEGCLECEKFLPNNTYTCRNLTRPPKSFCYVEENEDEKH